MAAGSFKSSSTDTPALPLVCFSTDTSSRPLTRESPSATRAVRSMLALFAKSVSFGSSVAESPSRRRRWQATTTGTPYCLASPRSCPSASAICRSKRSLMPPG